MKTSISYDWAAGFYDQSRDFPEAVATHGIQAILDTSIEEDACFILNVAHFEV